MKTEEQINARIQAILDEYAQLKELEYVDLTLKPFNDKGDVEVTLVGSTGSGRANIAHKIIKYSDSLDFIEDTFSYPEWIGRQSKSFDADKVRAAYKDDLGYLIVEHMDGSTERFKIKTQHHDEIMNKLERNLGDKLKI